MTTLTQPNPLATPGPLLAPAFGRPGRALQTPPVGGVAAAPKINSATGDVASAQYAQAQRLKAGIGQPGVANSGIATGI